VAGSCERANEPLGGEFPDQLSDFLEKDSDPWN
jgi:hypothetical protein